MFDVFYKNAKQNATQRAPSNIRISAVSYISLHAERSSKQ